MSNVLEHVVDSLDIETFILCTSEQEGRELAVKLMYELGFKQVNLVFCEFMSKGARIRVRACLNSPGDKYPWLNSKIEKDL